MCNLNPNLIHDDTCYFPVSICGTAEQFPMHNWNFSGGFDYLNNKGVVNSVYIKQVLYNDPVTVVFWSDGTKTTSKINDDDVYSQESGLLLCVMKKICGATNIRNLLHEWTPLNEKDTKNVWVTANDVRRKIAVGLNKHNSDITAEEAIKTLNKATKTNMNSVINMAFPNSEQDTQ